MFSTPWQRSRRLIHPGQQIFTWLLPQTSNAAHTWAPASRITAVSSPAAPGREHHAEGKYCEATRNMNRMFHIMSAQFLQAAGVEEGLGVDFLQAVELVEVGALDDFRCKGGIVCESVVPHFSYSQLK